MVVGERGEEGSGDGRPRHPPQDLGEGRGELGQQLEGGKEPREEGRWE